MKKVLLICYYWPPSGGAGVQRWLKLSHYLSDLGVEVHVIAPHERYASYPTLDPSLEAEIDPRVRVYKTRSFEPLKLYQRLVGKEKVPTAGMSNVDKGSTLQQLTLKLRSRLFIPDPRKYWKRYAYRMAQRIIRREGIQTVITTSPPHSAQLIGLHLQQRMGIHWIADLRDLWTGIYYYDLLQHSARSGALDRELERSVLSRADHITTVSPSFKSEFLQLVPGLRTDRISVIPNGYDPADFADFPYALKRDFVITYTGTISSQYKVEPFLEACKRCISEGIPLRLRFVGLTDPALKTHIEEMGLDQSVEYIPYVPHHRSIQYLAESYALLLVGPLNQQHKEGSIPAKVFEYMASGRPIIYLGKTDGFMAQLLADCEAGRSFSDDPADVATYLRTLYTSFEDGQFDQRPSTRIEPYSRQAQAADFLHILP